MQEIATVSKGAVSLPGHVPSHLLHPLLVRLDVDPGDVYLPTLKMDEKQHVVCHQSAQRKDLHCEKVGPRKHRQVSQNEWLFACAPVRAVRRDGAEHYRPFDPRPHAPDWLAPRQSDHNPRTGSPRPARTINSSTSLSIRGRPGVRRARDPSNLRAISLRYHAKMVSGRAVVATSPRDLRPNRWPISPSFARSASESLRHPFNWAFRIPFSAARYSFRSSSSWSTVPVM